MGTLKACSLTNPLPKQQQERLAALAEHYRAKGKENPELRAAEDLLNELKSERAKIAKQIKAEGGVVPPIKKAAPEKPAEAPAEGFVLEQEQDGTKPAEKPKQLTEAEKPENFQLATQTMTEEQAEDAARRSVTSAQTSLFGAMGNVLEPAKGDEPQAQARTAPIGRTTSTTAAQMRARAVTEFGEESVAALEKNILTIVDDAGDLPYHVRLWMAEFESKNKSQVRGAYDPLSGKVYIIANRLTTQDVRRLFIHEIGEHHGLKRLIGRERYAQLQERVKNLYKLGDREIVRAYDHVRTNYPKLKEGSDAFMSEVIAFASESVYAQEQSWWKDLVKWIKEALLKMGFTAQLSTEDIKQLVLSALHAITKEEIGTGGTGMLQAAAGSTKQTDTPEFKRWFGDSKVVDANGEPLVVYHGTPNQSFTAFNPSKSGTRETAPASALGMFFHESPGYASGMAATRDAVAPAVMPVYLSVTNPLRYEGMLDLLSAEATAALKDKAKVAGNDGIVDMYGSWVVFRPEQIKSAIGNRGTFDPSNPDIRAAAFGPIGPQLEAFETAHTDPTETDATSIKNVETARQRLNRGMPEAEEAATRDFGTVWDDARPEDVSDWDKIRSLAKELAAKPRPLTDTEDAKLLHLQIYLQNQHDEILAKIIELKSSGDQADMAQLEIDKVNIEHDLQQLYDIEKAVGTANARGLNARRIMSRHDYSLAKMLATIRSEKKGQDVTEVERSILEGMAQRIKDLERKLEEARTGQSRDKQFEMWHAGALEEGARGRQKRLPPGERRRRAKDTGKAIKDALRNGERPQDVSNLIQEMARQLIELGTTDRNAIVDFIHEGLAAQGLFMSKREVMDALSGYGKFRPLSKDEVSQELRRVRGELQQVAKIEDILAGKPLLKTGQERREVGDEERDLIRQVNELKKRYNIQTTDPETQLKSALDTVKRRLRNQISDYERQIAKREKIVKERSLPPSDPEVIELTKVRDELRAQFNEMFPPDRAMSDEAKARLAERNLEKAIAEYERKIAEGDIGPMKVGRSLVTNDKIEALRQRRDALAEELKELRDAAKPKRTKEQIAIQTIKTRMRNELAKLQDKIAREDFAPAPPKQKVQLDAEGKQLRFDLDQEKRKYHELVMKYKIANWTSWQRRLHYAKETAGLPRAFMTMADISAVLRQGAFLAYSHPVMAAKSVLPAIKAGLSAKTRDEIDLDILSRENAKNGLYKRAGLYLAENGLDISKHEEVYISRWIEKIPVARNIYHFSERSYSTFLNLIRADAFDTLAATVGRTEHLTDKEAEAIAYFVNNATGRGGGKQSSEIATQVFFSPRYLQSRFAMLALMPLIKAGSGRVAKQLAIEYARTAIGFMAITAMLGLKAIGDDDDEETGISFDPASTDFLKVRYGRTRIDLAAGLQQAFVFSYRELSGDYTTTGGAQKRLRGDVPYGQKDDTMTVAGRFIRSKLAPTPGLLYSTLVAHADYFGREIVYDSLEFNGEQVTPVDLGWSMMPMSIQTIVDIADDNGIPQSVGLTALSMLGVGISVHDE